MRIVQLLVFASLVTFHQFSFAAACPASSDTTTAGNGDCTITGGASTITLNFNSGFDSSTSATAIDGNNGTTVGAQRKLSFIKAAEIISEQVTSTVTLIVDASFTSLTCDSSSAVLGSAGASTNLGVSSGAPSGIELNTFYPIGLYNAITGSDADSGTNDIAASFNANIGTSGCLQSSNGWYYGFSTPDSNYIGFTTVLLHEMTHGLGFASLVNPSTGAKASGIDDIFSNNLYDNTNSRNWNDGSESDANRVTNATSTDQLLWSGSNVNTQAIGLLTAGFEDTDSDSGGTFNSGDKVQMYAPSSVESGSSVSHFNTDATPDELMEPSYTDGLYSLSLALYLLQDIGWGIVTNTAPTITAVDQSTNEDVAKVVDASGWGSDADSDTLTYSVDSACATNITCSINSDGTDLTMTPDADHNGATHTITINVSDGNGGTASDTLNLTVSAQNDDPTITAVDQSTNEDVALVVDISSWGDDVDGDGLTYTVAACASNITCSISGTDLTLTPASNHNGATHSITIQVDDSVGTPSSDSFNLTVSAQNDTPTWSAIPNQNITVGSNSVIDLNSYASDEEGDSLTYTATACGANLTCSVSSNSLTVTADAGAATTVTVTIEADDSNGGTSSDSFDVTINSPANNAPTLTAVDQSTNEDVTLVVNVSTWGSDADSDSLSYSVTTCASNITCSISGTNLTLTPASDHNGASHSITLEVSDGNGGATSDTFNLNVVAQNDAPTITAVNQTTNEDVALVVNMSSWGNDIDGDGLTYSVTTCASNITCSVSGTSLTLTPASNHNGATNSITIQINDSNGGTASDSFNLTVSAQSDAPTITAVDQTTNEDTALVVDISSWGSDVDGDSLTYSVTTCASDIGCAISGNSLTLTPDANHNGTTHSITIQVSDGNGGTASDSFNLTVSAQNDAPTITAVDQTTNEDTALVVDMSTWGSDTEGDTLSYSITTCASNITCAISGSDLTLTPDSDHNGTTHTITIEVADSNGGTSSDSFNLTVTAQNDAPTIIAVDQVTSEDTALVVDISTWGADVDGDSLTYSVTTCATNITCSISGNNLTLTPATNHNGATHSVTIEVADGNGSTASSSFNLNVSAQNDAPALTAIDQTTNEDSAIVVDISGWGSDGDGDALSYSVTTCASNITCAITGSNLTLTPASNHNGATHSITIQVSDGNGGTSSDSFNLTVTAVNDAPQFTVLANQTIAAGASVAVNLSDFSSDIDGDSLSYSATVCGAHLTCAISTNTLTITAGTGFIGDESVSIEVDDQNGGTALQSFTVSITASTNTAPTLTITDQTTLEDNALVVDLSGFANDADNDTLSYSVSACPTNITCALAGASLTLTPDTHHNGTTHTVNIEVTDGNGGTVSDSFNLAITAVNDAPVWQALGNLSLQIDESQNLQLASLVNDVDGDALSFSSACHANLTCSFSGSTLTITAVDGIGETVSIAIQADDGNGGTNTANLSITITSNLPSTHVEVDDALFNHGDSLTLNLDDGQVDVLGGSGNYAYELEFGGQDASQLITSNNSGLQIALPDSGAFAGTYTLTITDNSNGEVITLNIERPLRLNFSSEGLLNSDTSQTLIIEGGEAGSQYLVEEIAAGHLIFSDASGQIQNTFVAANSAQNFNGATVHLASNTVSDVTDLDIQVTSLDTSYSDVNRKMILYPAIEHSFAVTDTSGDAIAQAVGTLVENARLVEVNIELIHNADANGQFSIWLPDNDQFYGLNISANGYHPSDLNLGASLIEHFVTLTAMSNAVTLSGSINALGTQDFTRNNPTMSLHFSDGRSETIIVSVSNAAQASFSHEVDLNIHNLSTMRIEQVDSLDIEIDMSQITQNQSYNILLERTVAIVVSAPAPKESSGVGAMDLRYGLLLLLLGLIRKRKPLVKYHGLPLKNV